MAAFNFPNSPSTNDLHTENSVTWKWNGTVWKRINNSYLTASTLDISGIGTFGGLVDINAGAQANTFKVEDLTSGRVVLAGTGGEIEDSANLTFNGSDLLIDATTNEYKGVKFDNSFNLTFGSSAGTSPRIYLQGTSNGQSDAGDTFFATGTGGVQKFRSNTYTKFEVNADSSTAEALRITSSGFIGVGVASPNHMLQLHRSDSNNSYTQYTNSTTGSAASDGVWLGMGGDEVCYLWHQENKDMRLGTNNTERVRITAGGNFLIGGTNANYYSAQLVLSAGNGGGMTVAASSTSDSNFLTFADAASSPGYLAGGLKYQHSNDTLILRAGAAEKVEVQSAGHLKINDGDLIIGTSGHGISFAATSDASGMWGETLDDYEHGSFTPTTYGWGTATPYGGSNYNSGWYVKIGDIVHVGWKIYYNTLSGSNSHIGIGGFPFNSAGNHVSIAPVRFDVPETAVTYDLIYYMGSSGNTVWMYQKNSSGGITAINSSGNRSNVWAMGQVTYYSG